MREGVGHLSHRSGNEWRQAATLKKKEVEETGDVAAWGDCVFLNGDGGRIRGG